MQDNTTRLPFEPLQHFGFLTNRIARLIIQNMEPQMEEMGYHFPPSCIGVMADLWSKDGINQKELGISLIKTKSSINKMLTALEESGMIEKKVDPNDARGRLIFLTQKGRDMQDVIVRKSLEMEKDLLANVKKEDIDKSKKVLAEMYRSLQIFNTLST